MCCRLLGRWRWFVRLDCDHRAKGEGTSIAPPPSLEVCSLVPDILNRRALLVAATVVIVFTLVSVWISPASAQEAEDPGVTDLDTVITNIRN